MADVKVTTRKNGPLMVQGAITLIDAEGKEQELGPDPFALCRCGGSSNKPMCDGTHRTNGFSDGQT